MIVYIFFIVLFKWIAKGDQIVDGSSFGAFGWKIQNYGANINFYIPKKYNIFDSTLYCITKNHTVFKVIHQ